MADQHKPRSGTDPEDSWSSLWAWSQNLARRAIVAVFLTIVFFGFVWLHGKVNALAEHELAAAPKVLKLVRAGYTVGFAVAYAKLVYDMANTFVPVGRVVRLLWDRWSKP